MNYDLIIYNLYAIHLRLMFYCNRIVLIIFNLKGNWNCIIKYHWNLC